MINVLPSANAPFPDPMCGGAWCPGSAHEQLTKSTKGHPDVQRIFKGVLAKLTTCAGSMVSDTPENISSIALFTHLDLRKECWEGDREVGDEARDGLQDRRQGLCALRDDHS